MSIINTTTKVLRSPVMGSHQAKSVTEIVSTGANNNQPVFHKLGEQIGKLVDMFEEKGRRTIHQPMRDAMSSIDALYRKLATQMKKEDMAMEVSKDENSTQTSPWLKIMLEKRKNQEQIETPKTKKGRTEAKTKKTQKPVTKSIQQNDGNEDKQRGREDEWKKVTYKKDKKKKKPLRKPRPDAIVIETKGEVSYADILKSVKSDTSLKAIGEAVTKIRRTQKGELLLQFGESGVDTTGFKNSILEKLKGVAEVRTLTQHKIVEVRDIDEISTLEDIEEAIKTQLGLNELPDKAVSLRKAYGETQIATIALAGEPANKLLEAGKMRIGWTICRIRERTELKKCFKCLKFGHIAKQCRSKEDRSKLCRRCGNEGHIAKDCEKEPLCMFCKNQRPDDAKHIAGSSRCPVFRRALKDKR